MPQLTLNDIASSNPDAIAMLLQNMGQSSFPSTAAVSNPLSRLDEIAQVLDPVGSMPKDQAGVNELLRSLGASNAPAPKLATLPSAAPASKTPQAQQPAAQSPAPIDSIIEDGKTGYVAAISSLTADKNGWNLPKTGEVNTRGATERINARAQAEGTGVTATKNAAGQVTISNIGEGAAQPRQMASIPNDLASSISQLRTTTDPDIARGLLANIRETAAKRSTDLMTDAMTFAAQKLGVPTLEANLKAAEAADRADVGWYPGIGDSPITAQIRSQLLTTRASVDNEAKNFLSTNTSYAAMNASLKTAEEEAKRIERITQKSDTLEMQLDLRKAAREEEKIAQAQEIVGSFSPTEQARLAVLNPTIQYTPEDEGRKDRAMARTILSATKDKARMEALKAPDADLPILAMENNADALALTVAVEQSNNPSMTPEQIQSRLAAVTAFANGKDFNTQLIKAQFKNPGSPEAKKALQDMNAGSLGMDAAGKATARRAKLTQALDLYKRNATDRFTADTANWGMSDPIFVAAQEKAFKETGNRNFENVLTAYLNGATGTEALAKGQLFKSMVEPVITSQKKSLFGMPELNTVNAKIIGVLQKQGLFSSLMSSIGSGIDAYGNALQNTSQLGILPSLKTMGTAVSGPQVGIDPRTGQLRQQP